MVLVFDGSHPGPPLGYFSYRVLDDVWTWSEGLYRIHGFEPGDVPATTAALLAHKHPDDRARAFEVLENVIADGEPFSCYHRILDLNNRVKRVLAVGRGRHDEQGRVVQVTGYMVDLSEVVRVDAQEEVDAALVKLAESRAVIDQAKGMLMLVSGCDADEAFSMLVRISQDTNRRVRQVADTLVNEVNTLRPASTVHDVEEQLYLKLGPLTSTPHSAAG